MFTRTPLTYSLSSAFCDQSYQVASVSLFRSSGIFLAFIFGIVFIYESNVFVVKLFFVVSCVVILNMRTKTKAVRRHSSEPTL